MADPKTPSKKPLARCGERVVFAKLSQNYEAAYAFGAGIVPGSELADESYMTNESGNRRSAKPVVAMYLHPAGLVVVPKAGAFLGKRIVIPVAQVVFTIVAEEEA